MSPQCSQPSCERLGGLVGRVEVAGEDVAAAADDLAVVGEHDLAPGDGGPDGAGLQPVRRPRHRPRRLRHAVDLRQRHADRLVPLEQLARDRRRAGDGELDLVEADQLPHRAEGDVLEEVPRGVLLGGAASPRAIDGDGERGGDALVELRASARGRPRSPRDHAGVDLLPHARHAEDDVRPHLAQVRRDLAGLGAARHLVAVDELAVVARHALGDVRHRQVRHDALAGEVELLAERAAQRLGGVHDVEVRDHHALRRSGRARRVDDRGERLLGDVTGGRVEVDAAVAVEHLLRRLGQVDDLGERRAARRGP